MMDLSAVDRLRFDEARSAVLSGGRLIDGIGTQSEGTVHAVLKNYFEPQQDSQEKSVGGYIADIVGENGIIEIQTGAFSRLKEKLRAFLPVCRVTVVYPVYRKKIIVSVNGETGEIRSRRKSPLNGSPYELFGEIFPIAEFLTHPNLSFVIVMLEVEEYRIPPEAIGRKKRRANRLSVMNRIPTEISEQIYIETPSDWEKLIPCLYEVDFTTKTLAEAAGIEQTVAAMALNALFKGGIVERSGKKGRMYCYRPLV